MKEIYGDQSKGGDTKSVKTEVQKGNESRRKSVGTWKPWKEARKLPTSVTIIL